MKEKNNNRLVAYFSTSSSTSGGHLPSLFDTTSDVDSKVSSSQQKKRRQSNIRRRQQRYAKVFDIIKRLLVYGIALTAIASSVVSIFSCNFFSYTDSAVAADAVDGFTSALENDNDSGDSIVIDLGYQYTPFEFMNEAGVGLFAYYMGDPSEVEGSTILYKQEPMCFLYCDELHDFYWFSNNYNPDNKGLLTRKIDLWIVARYCAIIAPIVALLGLIQLVVVENWCCGYRINIVTHTATVTSSLFLFGTFLSASMIQLGTFSIMFASPNLSSPLQSDGITYQDSFCFSTTSSNSYVCHLDTGAFYSLGSGLVYLVLAVYSSLSTYSATTNDDEDVDTDRKVCGGGYCIRRGDNSNSTNRGSSSSSITNNDDTQVTHHKNSKKLTVSPVSLSKGRKSSRVVAADSEDKSETSDSSSSKTNVNDIINEESDEEKHDEDDHDHDHTYIYDYVGS